VTIDQAWREVRDLLGGEPFSVTDKIMHGGTAGYPLHWVEIEIRGNIHSGESFEEVIEQIKSYNSNQ